MVPARTRLCGFLSQGLFRCTQSRSATRTLILANLTSHSLGSSVEFRHDTEFYFSLDDMVEKLHQYYADRIVHDGEYLVLDLNGHNTAAQLLYTIPLSTLKVFSDL